MDRVRCRYLTSASSLILRMKGHAPTFQFRHLSLLLTFMYFGFFGMLFVIGLSEKTKPLPESIHKSVLKAHKANTATAVPAE